MPTVAKGFGKGSREDDVVHWGKEVERLKLAIANSRPLLSQVQSAQAQVANTEAALAGLREKIAAAEAELAVLREEATAAEIAHTSAVARKCKVEADNASELAPRMSPR